MNKKEILGWILTLPAVVWAILTLLVGITGGANSPYIVLWLHMITFAPFRELNTVIILSLAILGICFIKQYR